MFKRPNHGGITLEYIILSAFTAFASLAAMGIMKKTMSHQLEKMTEQLDMEVDSSDFENP